MFKTKVITSLQEVDVLWAFGYYLPAELDKTKTNVLYSIFNKERTPSMRVFPHKGSWVFKCFSSGNGGNILDLLKLKYNIPIQAAKSKLLKDYEAYIRGKDLDVVSFDNSDYVELPKFKLTDYNVRNWHKKDLDFWGKYFITENLLNEYKVAPLSNYVLSKKINSEEIIEYNFKKGTLYGYFNKVGDLYKVYQPGQKPKSMAVKSYLQGLDQLTGKVPNLLITKSLKDVMAFKVLGISNWESISAESESILIKPEMIGSFKQKYYRILTLFDNDDAGFKTALKYKQKYNLRTANFDLGYKDLSDTLEILGIKETKYQLAKSLAEKVFLDVLD